VFDSDWATGPNQPKKWHRLPFHNPVKEERAVVHPDVEPLWFLRNCPCTAFPMECQRGQLAFASATSSKSGVWQQGFLGESPLRTDRELGENRYVIENMERETGLEPATSSLGKWAMFCFQ
jgi:hypothetical protein